MSALFNLQILAKISMNWFPFGWGINSFDPHSSGFDTSHCLTLKTHHLDLEILPVEFQPTFLPSNPQTSWQQSRTCTSGTRILPALPIPVPEIPKRSSNGDRSSRLLSGFWVYPFLKEPEDPYYVENPYYLEDHPTAFGSSWWSSSSPFRIGLSYRKKWLNEYPRNTVTRNLIRGMILSFFSGWTNTPGLAGSPTGPPGSPGPPGRSQEQRSPPPRNGPISRWCTPPPIDHPMGKRTSTCRYIHIYLYYTIEYIYIYT